MNARLTLLALAWFLSGCDNIIALLIDPRVAQKVAESKAICSACRYGKCSIEDCHLMNQRAFKASIFEG